MHSDSGFMLIISEHACATYHHMYIYTLFPQSAATATINFPLLALAATIRGGGGGGSNPGLRQLYFTPDSLLFSSINFDCVMFKSTIFGSDYC